LLDTSHPRGQSAHTGNDGMDIQVAAHSLMLLQQSAIKPATQRTPR
jgi:hypothetical protein